MSIAEKLMQVAENTPKVFLAGAMEAIKSICPPINETGILVQCCPLEYMPFTVTANSKSGGVLNVCGKNLFDKTSYPLEADGYPHKTLGHLTKSENYKRTGFIPIAHLRGQTINLNHAPTTATNPGMAFYKYLPDGSESDCKTAFCGGGTGANTKVPDNAEYMCFCVAVANKDKDIQIELGSVATSYEAYDCKQYTVAPNSDFYVEAEPFYGINTIFSYSGGVHYPITVTGTTDPTREINRLKEYLGALSSASV